ncbi:uncharacterized protein LOC123444915 [Hordeum vulgare subsp. vulgare]|uniref:uncharacterized protein LOC123444915 n=1 Tax=Hordeum vulgare subsp. vulgare TaxID=112509 RepID=UPI00162CCC8F|nr:uncharacterized protein LOC123444915 [Hordeum vulgare subsp. vulgare]
MKMHLRLAGEENRAHQCSPSNATSPPPSLSTSGYSGVGYNLNDPATVQNFFRITHEKLCKVMFKPRKTWPAEKEDIGITIINPLRPISMKKSRQINCPMPLPEDPKTVLLTTTMLVEKPYMASKEKDEKKKEKKKAREGLRSKGPSDTRSEDTFAPSNLKGEEGEDDEEESGYSHTKKRAASEDIEGDLVPSAPKRQCRAPLAMFDDVSDSNEESEDFELVPRRTLGVKP